MKKFLNTFLVLTLSFGYSQVIIDTSKVDFIRSEWIVNSKDNDTTLNQVLTKYSSGIYKQEFPSFSNDDHRFPFINIFESKAFQSNIKLDVNTITHYWSLADACQKKYYNNLGILDSIRFSIYLKDSLIQNVYRTNKNYSDNGKLTDLINELGEKEVYFYNKAGKVEEIRVFRRSELIEIRSYENDLLISQVFPLRKKYRKKFSYDYDSLGRLILKDDSDYDLHKYYHNKFGVSKIEKIYKKKNAIVETTDFKYDDKGRLFSKKVFDRFNNLTIEFIYRYE